jgi:NTE family protein
VTRDRSSALESPALGSGLEDLTRPCGDHLRPHDPGRVDGRPTFAVTFSGGGFRATLAALGVVRFLADAGRLGDVRFVSSVSGGSIANGMIACAWPDLRRAGFSTEALDAQVIEPIVQAVTTSSLKEAILTGLWRALGRRTRTDLLANALEERIFHGRKLESLDDRARFIINAANLTTGVRFAFERDVLGDYALGLASTEGTGITVALAVAASAAVPGSFAPVRLAKIRFPCSSVGTPLLLDGGAYDNTGIEALDGDQYRDVFLVSMNAGGIFHTGRWGGIPIIRDLARANSLLYRQSTGLRSRWMVERFETYERERAKGLPATEWGRQGVLMGLGSNLDGAEVDTWRAAHEEHRTWQGKDLALVPTVFDRLDPRLCRLLIYRAWWLTGATLAQFHPGLVELPLSAPRWSEIADAARGEQPETRVPRSLGSAGGPRGCSVGGMPGGGRLAARKER